MSDTRLRCVVVVCGEPEPAVQAEHGDFGRWFVRALGAEAATRVIDVRATPASPAWLDDCDALVVSGSPHAVFEPHPWLPPLEELLRDAVCTRALPTLGVCFGHQLVAQALGGRVGRNPRGREMGTITVERHDAEAPLLEGLGARFGAQATHRDTVLVPPRGATVHARSDRDDCHVFSHGSAWGVQFHPEVTAPILRGYIRARTETLRAEGVDPVALHDAVHDTPTGPTVFRNFLRIAAKARDALATPSRGG